MAIDWGTVLDAAAIGASALGTGGATAPAAADLAAGGAAAAAPDASAMLPAAGAAAAPAAAPAATGVAQAAAPAVPAQAAATPSGPVGPAGSTADTVIADSPPASQYPGGVQGGNIQSQLFTDMQDPTKSDEMASRMAAHFDPPSGAHDFSTGAGTAPGAAPGPEQQMQLSDVPKYTPPPPPAAAKSGLSPDQRAKMASAFKAGGAAAQLGQQVAQSREQRPPAAPGGAPRSGTFTGLDPRKGLPAQGMAPPGAPAGPNAMVPASAQPVGQTPENLAQLYGRAYGQR